MLHLVIEADEISKGKVIGIAIDVAGHMTVMRKLPEVGRHGKVRELRLTLRCVDVKTMVGSPAAVRVAEHPQSSYIPPLLEAFHV